MEVNDSLANPVWQPTRPNNVPPPPPVDIPVQGVEGWKGLPVRADGDPVYLLKDGKRRWFSTKEAFTKMGFKLGDEVKIDQATLNMIPEGEPIQ